MTIRPYLHYNEGEILHLYGSVGWSFYVQHPDVLEKGIANSLCVLGAYDEDKLVGLIRCVGDGCTILFIQDLLVLPEYQRRSIGTALMKEVLDRYAQVYQIELATDNTEKTKAFYRSLGFRALDEIGCCGFMRNGEM